MSIKISEFLKDTNPRYVDITIGKQIGEKRFIDIFTIINCHDENEGYVYRERIINKVKTYFEEVLKAVKSNDNHKLKYLSKNIHDVNYTNLGHCISDKEDSFTILVNSIKESDAYKNGLINDILDAQLYLKNIGVEIISNLITNLIQDVLSEYTKEKLQSLNITDKIKYTKIHYWNEFTKSWDIKEIPIIFYINPLNKDLFNYLLVPYDFTCDENKKQKILNEIFNESVYEIYEKKILSNPDKYKNYINKYQQVYKKSVVQLINHELGEGSAVLGNGYITNKGLLALIKHYDEIKDFIEVKIKNNKNIVIL